MPLRLLLAALVALIPAVAEAVPPVRGIVWQLYEGSPAPSADYERLGVHELLLQWSVVERTAFVPGTGFEEAKSMPDWQRVREQPWARRVILGLSGRFDEEDTRRDLEQIARESEYLARRRFPFRVSGYYFPAEVDPKWQDPSVLGSVLDRLPRPLWISVYDSNNIGADEFAAWVDEWLPDDVGIFFQDGVGVRARTPPVARRYADALRARLGKKRVRVIAEAFRQEDDGTLRPATASELRPQLEALRSYAIYLFEGPHYVDDLLIDQLRPDRRREAPTGARERASD